MNEVNRWISVIEKLPEVDCPVLACRWDAQIVVAVYEDGTVKPSDSNMYIESEYFSCLNDWYCDDEDWVDWETLPEGWWSIDVEDGEPEYYYYGGIVAWMPLPEPYKGE